MKADNKPRSDAMTRQLQEKLRRRRLPVGAIVWAALILAVGFLCWFAWWIWSTPPPARLTLVAYDQLTVDASVSLKGRLVAVENDKPARLGGEEILFVKGQANQGGDELFGKVKSNEDGLAIWQGALPDDVTRSDYGLRLLGIKSRSELNDRAIIYRFSETNGILFVEITLVLTVAQSDDFRKSNLYNIAARPGSGPWLQKLLGQEERAVYLAPRGAEPLLYQKMRGWIREQTSNAQSALPAGPVLSWEEGKDLSSVAARFRGAKRAVAVGQETVEALRAVGAEILPTELLAK